MLEISHSSEEKDAICEWLVSADIEVHETKVFHEKT